MAAFEKLMGDYAVRATVFDELLAGDQTPRRHWQGLLQGLENLGPEELAARSETARRILRDHGVTYNVYRDQQGLDRPWELDLIPLPIPAEEWQRLEAGLAQRTRLLNMVLADFYGSQRLVRDGHVPPALVHANPQFLRPCTGLTPRDGAFLVLHGIDLARSPDGRWWVLADRTQTPSGAGYALENRIVVSRLLPDEFRDSQVQRLAGFFQSMRETLHALDPRPEDQPNVVILTAGPHNETFFEHAYLARYLGFPLVEGADLTVRDRRVFLKSLDGLQPVDVILRRLEDTYCDPLELRGDSLLGVAGLVEAARAGNVTLANALGSGVVETPALLPFLPGLCEHLLGEELRLPSVATWWCGQARECGYVVEQIQNLVVKRAFPGEGGDPAFGGRLTAADRERLLGAIQAAPHEYVGQEQVALSRAPAWHAGRLRPHPLVLRAYVCAAGQRLAVMPGGLARVSHDPDDPVVSMQSGGGSKDTWVLADGPVVPTTLIRAQPQAVRLERSAAEVPSRVADNLFWLGRYAERLEDLVRILRCVLVRLVGESREGQTPEVGALIQLLVRLDLLPERFRTRPSLAGLEREMLALLHQAHRLGTVREVLSRLQQIAYTVRDRFSADTWRIFNKLQNDARLRPGRIPLAEALLQCNTLLFDLAAFSGLEMENMTRGHGWRFLDIGRRLERSINLVTLAEAGAAIGHEGAHILEPMLEIGDSGMTYRRRYFAAPQLAPVLDLLLADDTNPRALAFQVQALAAHAANLPGDRRAEPNPVRIEADRLAALQRRFHEEGVLAAGLEADDALRARLAAALQELAAALRALSDAINHHFFVHTAPRPT